LADHIARASEEIARSHRLVDQYRQTIMAAALSGEAARKGRAQRWPRLQARELFSWASGKFLPKSRQGAGDVPVYGGNGVTGSHTHSLIDRPTIVVGRVGAHCGNVHLTAGAAWVTDNAIYAHAIDPRIEPRFAALVLRQSNLNARSGGTGQPYVNQDVLNNVPFHLPPLAEQLEIVERIQTASSWLDRLGVEQLAARRLLSAFNQAALAKAFRGELVPPPEVDNP
jgi:type I restriction enzyme, S subunit